MEKIVYPVILNNLTAQAPLAITTPLPITTEKHIDFPPKIPTLFNNIMK
jgi:hypothetical protein